MAPQIVVLGAGYSGLLAAKLAARRTGAPVTLINDRERFVERVRMHQLACGQPLAELPIRELLTGTGVEFVAGRAVRIDAGNREITLAGRAEQLSYDLLIYALGSHAELDSVPGAREYAHTVAGFEQARRLRDRLRAGGSVAVVGGGLTGIEAAAELAESHPDRQVRLVTGGELGAGLSARGGRYLRRALGRLGVECHEGLQVSQVDATGLRAADDEKVLADTVVWTAGFRVPGLAADAGFAVDGRGRMIVDPTLRSVSHPEVYGVGDAVAAHRAAGQELRMACATAIPSAQHATRAIAARLAGRTPAPLRFRYFNQCISLGRRDGLVQFVRADDSPVEAILTGRAAARYKEAIVRGTVFAQRHPGVTALV
ncbi:NAD(P)/FAD-dependent oxidoreductase [Amycolatopsis alkalitolerans]|uniref:Oxidoreductase n=1 Tax=Amycolatopsis alkalitolerans TaxID=2547244 RepID=A0A5C4M851_9PSEU|nr:FAD-dependent oxidoreductase [Amycolatopsis alkalitolerans]TNC29668.1 oxidoreductase [Amycolatopsis alkalitolerans]